MGQETLFDGIVRSIKTKAHWAVLIIAIAILASFLINRFSPSLYKSSSLIRVMTSAEMSENDIAAEMNAVLAQKDVQDEIIEKCKLDKKLVKIKELARVTPSDAGLLTLTVKYVNPNMLSDIGTAVIQILSNKFLLYSSEAQEFSEAFLQKKLEHLEKDISKLRKQKITSSSNDVYQGNSEIIDLECQIQMFEDKISVSSKMLQTTPQNAFYYEEQELPQYKSVKNQLAKANAELKELFKTYKEKHPKVIACQNNIKNLEYRLARAKTKVKKQKANKDYIALQNNIKNDQQHLALLKEELNTKRKLAAANLNSSTPEGLSLRLAALEEMHKKTLIELEESKISKSTTTGRINVLRKDHLPPQVVGFSAIQRDCLALLSGVLAAIFLLYSPAPTKTELVGISADAIANSLGAHLDLRRSLDKERKPAPIIAEPAETILRIPPLVSVPLSLPCLVSEDEILSLKYDERLVSLNDPASEILKPYKDLVDNLQKTMLATQTRIAIACSTKSNSGKTTMIANVAVLLAQAGYSVLLVDANFRNPSLHRMFGLNNIKGLSNLLNGEKIYDVVQKSPVENLSILCSGMMPSYPEQALGSQIMVDILDNLKKNIEIILIDTPALLDYPETAVLAGQTGAVVFLHRNGDKEENLIETKHILNKVGAKIFGYVKI